MIDVLSVAAFTIQQQSSCGRYAMACDAQNIYSLILYRISLSPTPALGRGWASVQTAISPVGTEVVSTREGIQGATEVWGKTHSHLLGE